MGIGKWILKNGPGSPGVTAKVYSKEYNMILNSNPNLTWKEIFPAIYGKRSIAFSLIGNSNGNLFSKVNIEDIMDYTEGDFTLFVFTMMFLETKQFRNNIASHNDTFLLSTEVLYETITENTTKSTKFSLGEFREKAIVLISRFK